MNAITVNLEDFAMLDEDTLDVAHPVTGAPLGWQVRFASPAHPQTRAYNDKIARDSLAEQRINAQRAANGRTVTLEVKDVATVRRDNINSVVVRILDWTPVQLAADAEPLAFSPDAAAEMLLQPKWGWLLKQFLDFLDSPASFYRKPAPPIDG